MKNYIYALLILLVTGTAINAQNNGIAVKDLTLSKLKGLSNKPELSGPAMLLNQETIIRNLRESRKKHDAFFPYKSLSGLNAVSSDSAYIYLWEDADWLLKYRSYYTFGAASLEILQEKLSRDDNSWNNYSKRILDYYSSGRLKKETEFFWQNSSLQWLPAYVEEYNSFGKIIEFYAKEWNDTTEQFTEGYRIASAYIKDTLLSAEILQYWESNSNVWRNETRTDNSYSNQLITGSVRKIWKETEWVNDYSIEYSYSSFGDLLTETGKKWDEITNEWINEARVERSYNSLGNVTNILFKQWDEEISEWINKYNKIISYDNQFRILSNLTQKWDGDSWIDSLKLSYTRNEQGRLLQYLEEIWVGDEWINLYRELYTHGSDQVTIKIDNWNIQGSVWENDLLITYLIDAFGYIISEQHEIWNSTLNLYETGYYDLYDDDGDNTEHYEKIWDDSLNVFIAGIRVLNTYYSNREKDIKQTILQTWDPESSGWENLQKTVYFWEGLVGVKNVSMPAPYEIYPVPFTDILNVKNVGDIASTAKFKIIDLYGRIVYETILNDITLTLDLSHLQKGMYLAEINTGEGQTVIKIMKY